MKSSNLYIRPFNEADRDKLKEIYLLCRIQVFYWIDSLLFTLNDFDAHTRDEDIWVAECDGGVVGFMAVWSPDAFIHHLYIDAAHRGKGIGKALLALAKQTYPSPLSLKCLVKNEAALQFYRALGWDVAEEGSDALGDYFLMKSK
ncbi:Ribosomal protein S18 acetylase RimI [Mucilaginibacter gossypiicola]|uniref:Ribosomal protein S18 acetylase RimI n=1 Tax=Mucilaginibacter gossypiicola TaxID=551995 RepID=A0A1H8N4A3_9SPHI|nr:GNAT family N-acetyltransferase [Mucilaginibacter gossypiicola]SEO24392.1 Ribosomal protein S18 acetylase RimI [Mucilaginibacter gossypiicola]